MKNNLTPVKWFSATLLAGLLLGPGVSVSPAAPPFPPSPVFSNAVPAWDCIITGSRGQRGIGLLTFSYDPDGYGNYSFDLRQINTKIPTSIPKVKVTETNTPTGRGGTSENRGEVDAGAVTLENLNAAATQTAFTNIYGYNEPRGSWGYDYKGRILGFYVEYIIDKPAEGTNPPTVFTNSVSFIGKVTPNKRFTAVYSSSLGGNGKYSGVPLKTVTNRVNGADFSGPWTGEEFVGPRDRVELFTMFPAGLPNAYDIIGDGPGYSLDWPSFGGPFTSKCLVSCQQKIAFTDYLFINETNSAHYTRATFGDLKNTTKVAGGNTKGILTGSNVVYKAFFVPFVPYP